MKKKDFIRAVAAQSNLPIATVERVMAGVVAVTTEQLVLGHPVRLPDLVAIDAKHYRERAARNPKTGEPCVIEAGYRLRVRPATALQDLYREKSAQADSAQLM